MKDITAYTTEWSAEPGDTLPFKVNCEAASYEADIVKLICGDTNPDGPGVKETVLETDLADSYPGREQTLYAGSYVQVPDDPHHTFDGGFTLQAYIYPTTPGDGLPRLGRVIDHHREQAIMSKWDTDEQKGYGLFINEDGTLEFRAGDGEQTASVTSAQELEADTWYLVGVSVDPSEETAILHQVPETDAQHKTVYPLEEHTVHKRVDFDADLVGETDVDFMIGASAHHSDRGDTVGVNCYNGKVDRPRVVAEALDYSEMQAITDGSSARTTGSIVGAWDFADAITPDGVRNYSHVEDTSPYNLHGEAINMPARGVTGHNWTGDVHEFTQVPEQYAALHFHDDDVGDARWETDFEWTIPGDLDSAVYAARLRTADDEMYVPFFVRPKDDADTADVVFLAPTTSYLAYSNDHLVTDDPLTELLNGHTPLMQKEDVFLAEHREYGVSCYDTHSDGYGAFYSSRLRPILTMQPKYKHWLGAIPSSVWQFNADLHLIDWLEEMDYEYDVVTDEDLHREGLDLLESYDVVMSGTHPEYYSEEMWTGLEDYQKSGGRIMYMGANGFYWQSAYHPENPKIIELRKGDTGIRGYNTPSGELCLSFSGQKGGLWRQRGMAPQKLVGTGFSAEGFDECSYYRRKEASYDEDVEFIFEGVEGDTIGDFGLVGHGAAGLELDRYDRDLGTPSHAKLLASSEGHSDNYLLVTEDILATTPGLGGTEHPHVRADMVYFNTENDGAVFSTSSISWCGSLAHDDYDNNVSTVTGNVLDAFLERDTLPN
ncbi:N,N-dimethylformamidase beta subunit family domain-containing protein [Halobellus sp. GM3]|uniref:N,N-dimethylformamidase beta subunit family domain-containing protein n=1 Tax=Halobellus sp. GM3 TaxID=3458410 RepID=UPI00403DBFCF